MWNPHGFTVVLGLISALLVGVVAYRTATFPRPRQSAPTP